MKYNIPKKKDFILNPMESNPIIKFKIDDECFCFDKSKIPKSSFLNSIITTTLKVNKDEDDCFSLDIPKDEFVIIHNYLQKGIIPHIDELSILDYFGIDTDHSYELSSVLEEDMRSNMYIIDDIKYKDNYYGLVKIDNNFWNNLNIDRPINDNMLFTTKTIQKNNWENINQRLLELKQYTSIKGVFIAGGAIFSILFGLPIKDIDIFLYSVNEQEALEAIREIKRIVNNSLIKRQADEIIKMVKENMVNKENINYQKINEEIIDLFKDNIYKDYEILNTLANNDIELIDSGLIYDTMCYFHSQNNECTRTANAITFKNLSIEVQVILRLYQTPSEIIHGFDVDSCCLGYDGYNVWMTQRAHFALKNGYNTVNFKRLSPSYELRLVKYGVRGMAIKILDFSRNKVNVENLESYFNKNRPKVGHLMSMNYGHLDGLKGLNLLIYLEYHCENFKYKPRSMNIIDRLNHEKSDYVSYPFVDMNRHVGGNEIKEIFNYLKLSRKNYPEFSDKYMPFIEKIENLIDEEFDDEESNKDVDIHYKLTRGLELHTNAVPLCAKMWFIKGSADDLDIILSIPDLIYKCLECVRPWNFSANVTFKITDPGQQMTNTFHQIVLDDNNNWYNGEFYTI